MTSLAPRRFRAVGQRLVRWLVSMSMARRSGLINVSALPARLTMPLRRDGLDPVQLARTDGESDSISKIGRILGMNVWLVSDHDQARTVLNDSGYSTDIRSLIGTKSDGGAIGGLGFTDPPEHTVLRKSLMPMFTATRLAALLPTVERIVEHQLDLMAAAGPVVDIVTQFAFPVPFSVICELLGLHTADRERIQRLGHDRFDVNNGGAGIFGAISESRELMNEAVSKQRRDPGTGLIATLLRTHGDEFDDATIAGLADGVFTGGYETSASMLALGVLALIQDPAAMDLIRADPGAIDGIVEELLRYLSVVQIAFPRFARQDHVLSGRKVVAGDVVICSLSRANRDDVFGAEPGRFQPTRAGRSHLAFGYGMHRCIGAELARMQLRVAFRGLVERFPQMTLAIPAGELQFHDLSIVYGLRSLPVRLTATQPVAPGRHDLVDHDRVDHERVEQDHR